MRKIAIIGAGNVGKVLGYALYKRGYTIASAFSRSEKSRKLAANLFQCPVYSDPEKAAYEAEVVFLTTPDRVIEEVCAAIASKKGFRKGQIVLHINFCQGYGSRCPFIPSPANLSGA